MTIQEISKNGDVANKFQMNLLFEELFHEKLNKDNRNFVAMLNGLD